MPPTDRPPVDTAQLRRLVDAATPGPWKATSDGEPEDVRVCAVNDECIAFLALRGEVTRARWNADARLMASAPELLARCADELDTLRAEVGRLRGALNPLPPMDTAELKRVRAANDARSPLGRSVRALCDEVERLREAINPLPPEADTEEQSDGE